MEIKYFNNCATTRVDDDIMSGIVQYNTQSYFNPSALGGSSAGVLRQLSTSRQKLAAAIGADKQEIIFTSGGTESNNMAILGSVKRAGGNIVTTHCEHSSVYKCVEHLNNLCEIRYAKCNNQGVIDIDNYLSLVDENTVLACAMHVNNETGAVNDIALLSKLIKAKNNKTVIFSDGVQAIGKVPVNVRNLGIDLYSISGHKLHAPKGIGALYVNRNAKLAPINFGGGQEGSMRNGTENVSGIIALATAVEQCNSLVNKLLPQYQQFCEKLTNTFNNIGDCHIVCCDRTPAIFSVAIAGMRAEVLINMLENYGIVLGSGSACSSKVKLNRVYSSIGLDTKYAEGIVRISFSKYTTQGDIDFLCEKLTECIKLLRKTIIKGNNRR